MFLRSRVRKYELVKFLRGKVERRRWFYAVLGQSYILFNMCERQQIVRVSIERDYTAWNPPGNVRLKSRELKRRSGE